MKHDVCFLGLDLSTQSLTAVIINRRLEVLSRANINFDADLPAFKTASGVHRHADGVTVTAPPLMWVGAMDLLLEKLRREQAPLDRLAGVSGSGQQHGSVWWRASAAGVLRGLSPDLTLREQLDGAFALDDSPVWMDASTGAQCRALERRLGGPQRVADLTGSRAYERFTGNQIARVYELNRRAYDDTQRIALVSSFAASLLIGDYAAIDFSDASGMNLLDIRRRAWAPDALAATADARLAGMLGAPAPAHSMLGAVHSYYCRRYGFDRHCRVAAFSGDNPNSLAGLRLDQPGAAALSLGTSDTLFGSTMHPAPSGSEGHVFVSPLDPAAFMVMLVRKNGSVTREQIRDRYAGGCWETFTDALERTPAGNAGCLGFYHLVPEITPPTLRTGIFRFDAGGRPVEAYDDAGECRAVVEGQLLCLRRHADNIGLSPHPILITGGASRNRAIAQVVADVFNTQVLSGADPDSAAMGAAYRALHAWHCDKTGQFVPFRDVTTALPAPAVAAVPRPANRAVYDALLERYAALEPEVL